MTIPENTGYPIERISEGIYGMSFQKDGETLHLRMEQLTKATSQCWKHYQNYSKFVASGSCDVLSNLVKLIGKGKVPDYKKVQDVTGFTEAEYEAFVEKARISQEKTDGKIGEVLAKTSHGSNHMHTSYSEEEDNYIIYVTKNPDFSIETADKVARETELTLKNFIEAYEDLLITVGTDFTKNSSFYTRGISRNPHWIFEQKYSGLSMLLHGFSALVAQTFYPHKKEMQVKPLSSMQNIIAKKVQPGEGYVESENGKIDLTELPQENGSFEYPMTHIKTSALTRIFNETLSKYSS